MPGKDKQRDIIFFTVLVIVQTCFYFLAVHSKQIYLGDSIDYIREAINIKSHFFFYSGDAASPIKEEYITLRPPLYPIFICAIYLFTINNWVVLFFQNVLCFLNILMVRDTLLHFGYKKRYDPLFLLFIIFYPAQFIFSDIVYSDILFQTFSVIYFRHFVLLVNDKRQSHVLWMSLAVIAGAMVKPVFYPFSVFNFILLLLCTRYLKIKLSRTLGFAVLPFFVFLLYNCWNYARTGKFHYSSIEAINAIYNCREYETHKTGLIAGGLKYDSLQANIASIPVFKDRYDTSIKIAGNFIKARIASYALFHVMHSARMLIDPGKNEIDLFMGWDYLVRRKSAEEINRGFYATLRNKGWKGIWTYVFTNEDPATPVLLLILLFNCIRLIGFCLFVFDKKIHIAIRLFVLSFVGYFAIVTGPVANTHYFLPVSLIMIGAAVIGLQNLFKRRTQSHIGTG